jgi:hypothetical protein
VSTVRAEHDPNYADVIDIASLETLNFTAVTTQAQPALMEDVDWRKLSQSTITIDGAVVGADDFRGQWLLAFDEALDRLAIMVNVTLEDIYVCPAEYPSVSSLGMNEQGAYWIERGDTAWRLMTRPSGGSDAIELERGTMTDDLAPVITAPEYHMLVLYEPATGRLRALNADGQWDEREGAVHTEQMAAPEAVEGIFAWTEETSQGWAVMTIDTDTGQERGFLLRGIKRPHKATFDGDLLLVQTVGGALYGYDFARNLPYAASPGVTTYQHIPGGAIVAARAATDDQIIRLMTTDSGVPVLLPLAAAKDGGRVLRTFHHSYELDVELFLIMRDGQFEKTTVSMRKEP